LIIKKGLSVKIENLRNWLEVIGIFGVLVSLLFVGVQLRQDKELGASEVVGSWMEQGSSLRTLIASNADTWYRACLGEDLQKSEKIIAQAIWQQYGQYQFSRWTMSQTGIFKSERAAQVAANNVAMHLVSFPALREMDSLRWSASADITEPQPDWSAGFGILIEARLETLTNIDPNRHLDISLCGMTL
jgi:hypothetical protein